MSSTAALYYIGPPGPVREACLAADGDARVFGDAHEFTEAEGKVPGLVVVAEESARGVLSLAENLWKEGPGWILAVGSGGPPPVFRSVSVGIPAGAEAIGDHLAAEAGHKGTLVDLREALIQIARTRHDVNNPLTAALAEVQILLMDAEDGSEDQECLLVVQEQLRRIRDLVASTSHLRMPRD